MLSSMSNAFVRKLSLYGKLDAEDVRRLSDATQQSQTVPALRDIIRHSDQRTGMFVLLEGWACRYHVLPSGRRQITAFLVEGDFFDLQIGHHGISDHNVGTLTKCLVSRIPNKDAEELAKSSPALHDAFWAVQFAELNIAREWIVNVGQRNSAAKIAHLSLELCARTSRMSHPHAGKYELPLTQQVLADALGITAVHINRVLAVFRREGIMTFHDKLLIVMNAEKLSQIAGFSGIYLRR